MAGPLSHDLREIYAEEVSAGRTLVVRIGTLLGGAVAFALASAFVIRVGIDELDLGTDAIGLILLVGFLGGLGFRHLYVIEFRRELSDELRSLPDDALKLTYERFKERESKILFVLGGLGFLIVVWLLFTEGGRQFAQEIRSAF